MFELKSNELTLAEELLRKLRVIRRLWNFHIRAVAAAVPIFIATTATSPVSSSLIPRLLLPPFSFLQLLSSDHPSPAPPSFLQLYCRSRATRKHNYAEFLFSRLFYVQSRMSVYLLLPLLAVAVVFYDPVAFFLSRCVKLLGNANEFGRSCFITRALVTLLPDTRGSTLQREQYGL